VPGQACEWGKIEAGQKAEVRVRHPALPKSALEEKAGPPAVADSTHAHPERNPIFVTVTRVGG
jgi:hypothetical protein